MDIAIVTGAETPLGLRLVEVLVRQGCRVHGIGNNFSRVGYADPAFKAHAVDLTDTAAVGDCLTAILEKEQRLDILIHAIDVTPGTPFEKLPPGNLEAVLKVGLMGPVMLTRLALPNLLRFRGQLINVVTSNKNGHSSSALNALIEGGLREMNRALFDQARDAGLRVTNCVLRQNTRLAGAQVSDAVLEQTHIDFEDVARSIEQLLDPKVSNVPEELVLYPRLSAAAKAALPEAPAEIDAYDAVTLPPKAYCPPEEPKIPTASKQTVERSIPYTDEEMDDKIAAAIEDFEAHPERYEQPEKEPKPRGGGAGPEDGASGKPKRRRRRGGRNRNKNKERGDRTSIPDGRSGEADKTASGDRQAARQSVSEETTDPGQAFGREKETTESKPGKAKTTRSKKPGREQAKKPEPGPATADEAGSDQPKMTKPEVVKKAAEETAGKTVRKTARKAAKKKTATKKKTAAKKVTKKAVKKTVKRPARKAAKKATATEPNKAP